MNKSRQKRLQQQENVSQRQREYYRRLELGELIDMIRDPLKADVSLYPIFERE